MRRPIDFNRHNTEITHPAGDFGYIISHIGGETYRPNIRSKLSLSLIAPGSIVTISLLVNHLKSQNSCKDNLVIENQNQVTKICGSDTETTYHITGVGQNNSNLIFKLLTNNDRFTGYILLTYNGESIFSNSTTLAESFSFEYWSLCHNKGYSEIQLASPPYCFFL